MRTWYGTEKNENEEHCMSFTVLLQLFIVLIEFKTWKKEEERGKETLKRVSDWPFLHFFFFFSNLKPKVISGFLLKKKRGGDFS